MDKIRHEDSRGTARAKQFGDKAMTEEHARHKGGMVADDLLW